MSLRQMCMSISLPASFKGTALGLVFAYDADVCNNHLDLFSQGGRAITSASMYCYGRGCGEGFMLTMVLVGLGQA